MGKMACNLSGRSLLRLSELTVEEIRSLLDLSREVKAQRRRGEVHQRFVGKSLAMLFEKRSTRTRCAFETAFGEEGGHPVFLSVDDIQKWKPAPEIYQHAATSTGVPLERVALVAAHAWDTHGAHEAGLVTGWVSRLEDEYPRVFAPPDVTGPDLVTVVDGLLRLPA